MEQQLLLLEEEVALAITKAQMVVQAVVGNRHETAVLLHKEILEVEQVLVMQAV